ncbi:MAG: TIGR04086 family membrane protein [Firmicutes bacterium]|jgi:putative membrane protein (TIGR04086 family)|nr:TIGR04086 family membrane protein [Bacillota bacterium]
MNRQPGHHIAAPIVTTPGLIKILLKAVALALILSVVLLFIAALVFYFTAVSEKITPYLVFGVSLVAIITGSSYAGKHIGTRGWLYGGIVGLIYVILMLATGIFIRDSVAVNLNLITKLFLGFVFGAIGGMWGVNR